MLILRCYLPRALATYLASIVPSPPKVGMIDRQLPLSTFGTRRGYMTYIVSYRAPMAIFQHI